jgi:ribA/ribD-fused uncharacterized protein
MAITRFTGEYRFLSNFYPKSVMLDGVVYPTVENAYQASKTIDKLIRLRFGSCTPAEAKKKGRLIPIRPDWDKVKVDIMRDLVAQKFEPPSPLGNMLLATIPNELIEGNHWGDKFWGCVIDGDKFIGENMLGKILMEIRNGIHKLDFKGAS